MECKPGGGRFRRLSKRFRPSASQTVCKRESQHGTVHALNFRSGAFHRLHSHTNVTPSQTVCKRACTAMLVGSTWPPDRKPSQTVCKPPCACARHCRHRVAVWPHRVRPHRRAAVRTSLSAPTLSHHRHRRRRIAETLCAPHFLAERVKMATLHARNPSCPWHEIRSSFQTVCKRVSV